MTRAAEKEVIDSGCLKLVGQLRSGNGGPAQIAGLFRQGCEQGDEFVKVVTAIAAEILQRAPQHRLLAIRLVSPRSTVIRRHACNEGFLLGSRSWTNA
jgi:hypothetical protein